MDTRTIADRFLVQSGHCVTCAQSGDDIMKSSLSQVPQQKKTRQDITLASLPAYSPTYTARQSEGRSWMRLMDRRLSHHPAEFAEASLPAVFSMMHALEVMTFSLDYSGATPTSVVFYDRGPLYAVIFILGVLIADKGDRKLRFDSFKGTIPWFYRFIALSIYHDATHSMTEAVKYNVFSQHPSLEVDLFQQSRMRANVVLVLGLPERQRVKLSYAGLFAIASSMLAEFALWTHVEYHHVMPASVHRALGLLPTQIYTDLRRSVQAYLVNPGFSVISSERIADGQLGFMVDDRFEIESLAALLLQEAWVQLDTNLSPITHFIDGQSMLHRSDYSVLLLIATLRGTNISSYISGDTSLRTTVELLSKIIENVVRMNDIIISRFVPVYLATSAKKALELLSARNGVPITVPFNTTGTPNLATINATHCVLAQSPFVPLDFPERRRHEHFIFDLVINGAPSDLVRAVVSQNFLRMQVPADCPVAEVRDFFHTVRREASDCGVIPIRDHMLMCENYIYATEGAARAYSLWVILRRLVHQPTMIVSLYPLLLREILTLQMISALDERCAVASILCEIMRGLVSDAQTLPITSPREFEAVYFYVLSWKDDPDRCSYAETALRQFVMPMCTSNMRKITAATALSPTSELGIASAIWYMCGNPATTTARPCLPEPVLLAALAQIRQLHASDLNIIKFNRHMVQACDWLLWYHLVDAHEVRAKNDKKKCSRLEVRFERIAKIAATMVNDPAYIRAGEELYANGMEIPELHATRAPMKCPSHGNKSSSRVMLYLITHVIRARHAFDDTNTFPRGFSSKHGGPGGARKRKPTNEDDFTEEDIDYFEVEMADDAPKPFEEEVETNLPDARVFVDTHLIDSSIMRFILFCCTYRVFSNDLMRNIIGCFRLRDCKSGGPVARGALMTNVWTRARGNDTGVAAQTAAALSRAHSTSDTRSLGAARTYGEQPLDASPLKLLKTPNSVFFTFLGLQRLETYRHLPAERWNAAIQPMLDSMLPLPMYLSRFLDDANVMVYRRDTASMHCIPQYQSYWRSSLFSLAEIATVQFTSLAQSRLGRNNATVMDGFLTTVTSLNK